MLPKNSVALDEHAAVQTLKLLDLIEDLTTSRRSIPTRTSPRQRSWSTHPPEADLPGDFGRD